MEVKHKQRIPALDWVKGALVVSMVVYHAINYSVYLPYAFRSMAFLPPSFIFIAGFLVAAGYRSKPHVPMGPLTVKLVSRGAKLLAVFTVLNIGITFVGIARSGDSPIEFLANWRTVYFGEDTGVAAFYILVPIAYTVMLSPFFLWISRFAHWLLPVVAAVLVADCIFLEYVGALNYHVGMVVFGVVGMALGRRLSVEAIGSVARRWLAVVPAYLVYRIASFVFGDPFPIQLAGVLATLFLLYGIALHLSSNTWMFEQFVVMGRHSLFGYVFQLGVIQGVVRVIPGTNPLTVAIVFSVTMVATWVGSDVVDRFPPSRILRTVRPVQERA